MENLHKRAWQLIDKRRIEGLGNEELRWLEDHLAGCEACSARATSTQAAVRMLKSISIPVPAGLAASTSLRVHKEVIRLKQRRSRNVALIAGCTLSWIAGVASAPLVWRLCEWLGTTLDLPGIVWKLGFLSWWLVPSAAAGLVILWARMRAEREDSNGSLETGPGWNER